MVLVDIGNSYYHIWENGKIYNIKKPKKFDDEIFYISVNEQKEYIFKKLNPRAFNLKQVVKFDSAYVNLGIDRIMACKTVDDGIVVDAGSAVTIDIMQNKIHLGGVIMPGIYAFKKAFKEISEKLDTGFSEINFLKLPQNTSEAITYGSIGSIILMINHLKKDKQVYFTGGDGKFFNKFIKGIYVKDLVFRGMLKTIKEDL